MKLSGAAAAAFCRTPDPALTGALLHGPDDDLVAARRRDFVNGLLGPDGDSIRVERLESGLLRRDPAALEAALRARGFFSERGLVLVEGATESVATAVAAALEDAAPDDAFLLVTAGALPARSALRRLFESGRRLMSLAITAEAPDMGAIEARLSGLGVPKVDDSARMLLASLAAGMSPASFERFLETVALSVLGRDGPLTAADVAALAPSGLDAELDAFVEAVAGGRPESIGPLLRRLAAAGGTPVGLMLGLQRHFRRLMLAASAEGGPEAGLERLRPPLWGARRDAFRAQLRGWRRDRLETAARLLFETDARLRSAERAPAMALVERCALRLSMMAGR